MADNERLAAPVIAWIGLGSNLQEPVLQLAKARQALARLRHTELLWHSRDYLSKPVGGVPQPDFLNAVSCLRTHLGPQTLLMALQEIEEQAGRSRSREIPWGPRVLDLDILIYGDLQLTKADLQIPHPQIARRAFVLLPLAEYDPNLEIPGLGKVHERLGAVSDQLIWPYPELSAQQGGG
ncbi:MAG: 2-amino-4-hydroxy-6-hydroxymethyldihydropteridine diphosphokinase [Acidithiobacillus sp.]|nr:2-amino-4-hydroxy-6-hydroxymethyldihydropteridine diphosphokinase [Acidithiobacillus sp.]